MTIDFFPLPTLEEIRSTFAVRQPAVVPVEGRRHAAVAMIFRQGGEGAEILFLQRARREGDPWSGDIGFPGGKIEEQDVSSRAAAERETLEEIGLDLRSAVFLGSLDDIFGDHLPVQISCFLYRVDSPPPFTLSEEVVDTFWIPLVVLVDPARRVESSIIYRGEALIRRGIDVLGPGRTVLWGITYRLVHQFLSIMRG